MANNRVNSNFQILHFIVGAKHTPDGAYAALLDLEEDRQHAIECAKAAAIKHRAEEIRITRKLNSADEADRIEAEGELLELQANAKLTAKNVVAAEHELEYIRSCKARLEPYRKYRDMELADAIQETQRDEWRLEMIRRAENYLLTGGIPADQFGAMRLHPDFSSKILPHIESLKSGGKLKIDAPEIPQLVLGVTTS